MEEGREDENCQFWYNLVDVPEMTGMSVRGI